MGSTVETRSVPPRPGGVPRLSISSKHLAFWTFALVLGVFVALPLGLLVLNSFRNVTVGGLGFGLSNLTIEHYVEAYSRPATYSMLSNSLWFAVGSMAVALGLGGTLAFLAERTDLRFKHLIPVMVLVPLIMPSIVKGIAWIFLLSPNIGFLNLLARTLGLEGNLFTPYSLPAMIWVEGVSMSPLAFLLLSATIKRMDPSLEDAALGSGAPGRTAFLRITLPMLMPALAGVAILLFIRGIETFEIPMLMGFNAGIFVFSTNIYYALRSAFPPSYGLGFAYSMTLVAVTLVALFVYTRQMRHSERFTTVSGRGYRPRLIPLGRWRLAGEGFVAFYLITAILLPLLVLVWGSLLPFYQAPSAAALASVGLANYQQLFASNRLLGVVKNTAILAGVSTVAIMLLSVLSSWFVYRTTIAGRKVLDFIIFLPYAMSGVVVGVAFLILFLSFPNPVYNTIWIIVLAYILNYLPTGTRFTNASIVQVHKELEEAAWGSGVGFWTTLRVIWIPLLTPALINGGLFVLILSIKVMSVAALLGGPDSMVLSVYLWRLWDVGDSGPASALAVLLLAFMGALTLIARRVGTSLDEARTS